MLVAVAGPGRIRVRCDRRLEKRHAEKPRTHIAGPVGVVPGDARASAPTAPRSWPPCRACATELGLSPAGVEWAVNAYLVVSAAFIVLGGQAADRFGARAGVDGRHWRCSASRPASLPPPARKLRCWPARALQGFAAAFAVPSTLAAVDLSASAGAQGRGDRRLDRLPDARLQHRAARSAARSPTSPAGA